MHLHYRMMHSNVISCSFLKIGVNLIKMENCIRSLMQQIKYVN